MSDNRYITNEKGEKTAVVVPIDRYERLVEDLEDLAAVAERKDEPSISHQELIDELKKDGIISA